MSVFCVLIDARSRFLPSPPPPRSVSACVLSHAGDASARGSHQGTLRDSLFGIHGEATDTMKERERTSRRREELLKRRREKRKVEVEVGKIRISMKRLLSLLRISC